MTKPDPVCKFEFQCFTENAREALAYMMIAEANKLLADIHSQRNMLHNHVEPIMVKTQ